MNKVTREPENIKAKTVRCCIRLGISQHFPENCLKLLEFQKTYVSTESLLSDSEEESNEKTSKTDENTNVENSSSGANADETNRSTKIILIREKQNKPKMPNEQQAEKQMKFMQFASSTLRNYSGDALALQAFTNAITMLKTMSAGVYDDALQQVVMTKIEGKACQYVKPDSSVDEIIAALKKNITLDTSKVVLSNMRNLRLHKLTPQEYSKQAEELAETLQRSLVFEGISHDKANEMTIDHTIEICRKNAKSSESRSVIASSAYKNPKEVISKLLTEQSKGDDTQQVFAYKRFNRNRNFSNRGGWRGGHSGGHSGNNQSFSQNKNNSYNNSGGNNNWRNKSNRNNRGGRKNFGVRFSENLGAPSDERRGTENPQSTFTLERVNVGQ